MHRTLNIRFSIALFLASLLGSAGIFGLYRFQEKRLAPVLLDCAETAANAGQPERAVRYFQRYLRARPGDQDALARYGLLLDEQAQTLEERTQGLRVLNRVLKVEPQRDDLRKRLARRTMEIGQFAVAEQHLKILLTNRPGDSELENMLAQCALARKEYLNAAAWLEKAVQHAPKRIEAYLQLAALQNKLENGERRREVIDALVAANPTSYQAHLARARVYQQKKNLDVAAQEVARALALAPRDFDVLAVAAEIAFAQGKLEQTRKCLQECLPMRPQRPGLYLLLATVEQQAGRYSEAIACLRQGIVKAPTASHDALRLPLVDLLILDGRLPEARSILQELQKGKTAPLLLDFLDARLLVQEGQWNKAAATIQHLRGLTSPAEVALADQLRQVAEQPDDYRRHLALGLSLWTARGASAEVEATLRRAVTLGDWPADALAATLHYLARTRQPDRARVLLEQAREKLAPSQAAAPLAYGYELLACVEEAGKVYDDALISVAVSPAILRAGADFYLRHNQFAKAAPCLRRLLDPQSKSAAADLQWARRNLALGLAASGGYPAWQQSLALLEKNRDLVGETRDDQRALAVVLAQQPTRRAAAIALFEKLKDEGSLSAGDLFLLVQLHEANRDWSKARQTLKALLAAPGGKTPGILAYAVQLELHQGAVDEAQAHLAELAKGEPDSLRTVALEARLARARGNNSAAVELLHKLAARDGADLALLAALLEEMGQMEAADTLLRTRASAGKQLGALLVRARFLGRRQRLGEALDLCEQAWKTCPPAEAAGVAVALLHADQATAEQRLRVQHWLQHALAKDPKANSLMLALADVQDLQGRSTEAIKSYRQVLAHEAGHVLALNNLAWLLACQDDKGEEALSLIDKAIGLVGPAPQLLDTRAVVYLALGNNRSAVRDLETATAVEGSPSQYFHLAQAYWLRGQRRDAEEALRKARAAKLTVQHLRPSERIAYQKLLRELGPM